MELIRGARLHGEALWELSGLLCPPRRPRSLGVPAWQGAPDAGLVLWWERHSCHESEWGISQRGDDAAQRARAPTWAPGGLLLRGRRGVDSSVLRPLPPPQNLKALALYPG